MRRRALVLFPAAYVFKGPRMSFKVRNGLSIMTPWRKWDNVWVLKVRKGSQVKQGRKQEPGQGKAGWRKVRRSEHVQSDQSLQGIQGQWLCDQRGLGSWEHWFHGLYTSVGVPARKIFQRRDDISRDLMYYCKCFSLRFLQQLFWGLGTLTLWNTQTTVKTHSFLIEVLSNASYIEFSYFSINWSSMLL